MGKLISLYDLFQLHILKDADLLEIGKKKGIEKIILVEDQRSVQVYRGEGGWLFSEYKY